MPTTRENVEKVKQSRYESYQVYEFDRLRTNEITDQSERLRAPMENSFDYELVDGRLSFKDQYLDEILDVGIEAAENVALQNPAWQFELDRRKIERSELDDVQAFARGEIDAEALVVLSPIPDAVRHRGADIGGYNKDRNKMLARVITKTDDGVRITSLSLDQSNYSGMQDVAETLGHKLEDGLGSEDILKKRFWIDIPVESDKELVSVIRESYDKSLTRQLGGEWYGGRRPIEVKDALAFISSQADLMEEHLNAVQSVMNSITDRSARARKLEDLRYNYAAALDKRMNGEAFDSMAAAGADAHAAGENFDGDCATGSTSSSSAANSLEKLGYKRKVTGNCPFCKARVEFDPCDPECSDCGATKKGPGKKPQYKVGESVVKSVVPKTDQRFTGRAKSLEWVANKKTTTINGHQVERRVAIGVGGTIEYFVDKRTGERIN